MILFTRVQEFDVCDERIRDHAVVSDAHRYLILNAVKIAAYNSNPEVKRTLLRRAVPVYPSKMTIFWAVFKILNRSFFKKLPQMASNHRIVVFPVEANSCVFRLK